jgi:hypothetical protein
VINHWKPLGGFIENTIRPLLDELHWFFEECDKRNLPITKTFAKEMIDYVTSRWLDAVIVKSIQNVIIAGIIGYVICKVGWML